MRHGWIGFGGLLAVVTAAVAAAMSGLAGEVSQRDAALAVAFSPVPLDPTDPARDRVGSLRYLGGLRLRSSDPRFGGLSDLRVSPDGAALRAVSDCGRGFVASLGYESHGRLAALLDLRVSDLDGRDGRPLRPRQRDAESLIWAAGSLEVGFEGTNRVLAYAAEPPFSGPARPMASPGGLHGCGDNGGLETMARLDERRRLLICEARRGASLDVPAWVGGGGHWTERSYPLLFAGGWAGEPFRPTSASWLPGGDVLVLERRFPPIAARIVRVTREDLEGEGPLHPQEIVRFEPPLTLDNFEGIETRQDAGRTLVYLISDDNGCAKAGRTRGTTRQRTLLLMFALE